MATNNEKLQELSVEEKLQHLYELQRIDTEIDKIKTLRGELPLEVQDLEDEIAGLETRLENLKNEISEADKSVTNKKQEITKSEELIKKYSEQLDNVRNNREYDALTKEVEFQKLEIELQQKRIREALAVVTVDRDACGGCFNKIPPQRQLDIRSRKKIIVCEYCGRILIDKYICDYDGSMQKADLESAMEAQKKKGRRIKKSEE